jgi:hypothetical protein
VGQARPTLTSLIQSDDARRRGALVESVSLIMDILQRFDQAFFGNGFPKQLHDDI